VLIGLEDINSTVFTPEQIVSLLKILPTADEQRSVNILESECQRVLHQ
jgi:hypothetical protein